MHHEIAAMRSDRGAARLRILPPGLGQRLGEALLDLERRQLGQPVLDLSGQVEIGVGKPSGGSIRAAPGRARSGAGPPRSRPRQLQPGAPGRRATTDRTGRRATASPAGGRWSSARAASRAGSPLSTRRSRNRRRSPAPSWNSRSMAGVSQTTLRVSASAAWLSALPSICTLRRSRSPSRTWAVRISTAPRAEPRRATTDHGPAPLRSTSPSRARRSPRPGARNDRFQQIGLAGAVWPGQHHRPRIGLEPQARVAAEIDQRDPADSHTRRRSGARCNASAIRRAWASAHRACCCPWDRARSSAKPHPDRKLDVVALDLSAHVQHIASVEANSRGSLG